MSVMLQASPLSGTKQNAQTVAFWPMIDGGTPRQTGESALAPLQGIGATLRFKRNAAVFSEGDPSSHVYKVVSGAVRTCRVLMDGRRQIADFFLPGDFFGLDWQSEHAFTAEAVSDAVIISYPRAQIETLGDTEPGIRKLLMALLCKGLSETQDHLVMLGRQTAQERLAWFLLTAMKRTSSSAKLDLPMSRLDIADYLGLTIETVSRGISEFKRRRYITVAGAHEITVRNADMLQALASGEIEA
ncbi:MAG TPA: helix-turn-helix domain-containing protein [Candidatus Binatia bacterium]|nr:helix-turn-helix domain-containing protein [Candidatus Binatia bacterium]